MNTIPVLLPRDPLQRARMVGMLEQMGLPATVHTQSITKADADQYVEGGFSKLQHLLGANAALALDHLEDAPATVSGRDAILGQLRLSPAQDANRKLDQATSALRELRGALFSTDLGRYQHLTQGNALAMHFADTARLLARVTDPKTMGAADRLSFDNFRGALVSFYASLTGQSFTVRSQRTTELKGITASETQALLAQKNKVPYAALNGMRDNAVTIFETIPARLGLEHNKGQVTAPTPWTRLSGAIQTSDSTVHGPRVMSREDAANILNRYDLAEIDSGAAQLDDGYLQAVRAMNAA